MHELVLELVSPYRGWDEFPEFAFHRFFGGLAALGIHLERHMFLGAADIQAVNQQPIDEVLTMLHKGK
jgi:hypothetical protein